MLNLDEIRARYEAATKGLWGITSEEGSDDNDVEMFSVCSGYKEIDEQGYGVRGNYPGDEHSCIGLSHGEDDDKSFTNAQFTAFAHQDIPDLLERVKHLEALVDNSQVHMMSYANEIETLQAQLDVAIDGLPLCVLESDNPEDFGIPEWCDEPEACPKCKRDRLAELMEEK